MTASSLAMSAALLEDERSVIARGLARRDPEVLDQLITEYQHRLYRYLLHLTAEPALAEDLFQETWLRVVDRGRQYDGRSSFGTWLLAIARHLTIDHLRRRRPASLDALLEEEPGSGRIAVETGPTPFDLVVNDERAQRVDQGIAALPAIHREMLVLRFREEMPLAEIAVVVGVPLSTVKSRLYRALAALAERMERS